MARALVADDDLLVLDLVAEFLTASGHQVDHPMCRVLGSTWAVFTNDPPATWHARVPKDLGAGPQVLVVGLMSSLSGHLPDEAMAWLDRHLGPARA